MPDSKESISRVSRWGALLLGVAALCHCNHDAPKQGTTSATAREVPVPSRTSSAQALTKDTFAARLKEKGFVVQKVMPSLSAVFFNETRVGFVYTTKKGFVDAVFFANPDQARAVTVTPVTQPAPSPGRFLYRVKSAKTNRVINANAQLCWTLVDNVLIQSRSRAVCDAVGTPLNAK